MKLGHYSCPHFDIPVGLSAPEVVRVFFKIAQNPDKKSDRLFSVVRAVQLQHSGHQSTSFVDSSDEKSRFVDVLLPKSISFDKISFEQNLFLTSILSGNGNENPLKMYHFRFVYSLGLG
jgi:hypothetical protein